jgi:hypothetical protein
MSFWYNTRRGFAAPGAEGTLTAKAEGVGYLEVTKVAIP